MEQSTALSKVESTAIAVEYEVLGTKVALDIDFVKKYLVRGRAEMVTNQELVMFITELNSGYYSVRFLQNGGCERYYRYNRELLFDEKRRKLLERLE